MQLRRYLKIAVVLWVLAIVLACWKAIRHVSGAGANGMNTIQLMTAAAVSAPLLENAAFLCYAGAARYEIDKQVYVPLRIRGDVDGGVAKASLSGMIVPLILPRLEGNPDVMSRAVKRFARWQPTFDSDYSPGWKHEPPLDDKSTQEIAQKLHRELLAGLEGRVTLALDEEYVKLTKELKRTDAAIDGNSAAMEVKRNDPAAIQRLMIEWAPLSAEKTRILSRMRDIRWDKVPSSRWHSRVSWKAEDYFNDPKVIALCRAIEAADVAEMEKLIVEGVDVNTRGKDGVTLLLWALPDAKPQRFECLLRHGANPNVYIDSNLRLKAHHFYTTLGSQNFFGDIDFHAGEAVTHLAARSPTIDYLRLVFTHGGDVNLIDKKTGQTPLDIVLDRKFRNDIEKRVEILLPQKPDLNRFSKHSRAYPVGAPSMRTNTA